MAFCTVDVVDKGKVIASGVIDLASKKNLFAAIRRKFSDFKFIIDKKYGAEVSEIAGLKKSKNAGLEFRIDDKVPWTTDPKTGKKLYISLYHITATEKMLAGKRIVLELVSINCNFENSVVDARLDFRTDRFDLEALPPIGKEVPRYRSWQAAPDYPMQIISDLPSGMSVDYFRYFLLQNLRSLGGWRKKPSEPDVTFYGVQAPEKKAQLQLPIMATKVSEYSPASSFNPEELSVQVWPPSGQTIEDIAWEFPSQRHGPPKSFKSKFKTQQEATWAGSDKSVKNASLQMSNESGRAGAGRFVQAHEESNSKKTGSHMLEAETTGRESTSNEKTGKHPYQPPKSLPSVRSKKRAVPLSSLKDFKVVIFDLDGIIVDSEKAHLLTFNKVLLERGLKIDERMWRNNYTGIGSVKIMEDVFRRNGIQEDIHPVVAKRAKIYQKHVEKIGLSEIAGFRNFQRFLLENKVKFMVASGGHKPSIAASLRSIGLPNVKFVGLEDVKHGKPNPEIFLLAAKKLGVKPGECVVFEDSLSGMEAAIRAGMPCISFPTTLPVRILKGRASAIFRDYNSPGLKTLFTRLIREKKRKLALLAKKKQFKIRAPKNKRKKKKFYRPFLLRLGRR